MSERVILHDKSARIRIVLPSGQSSSAVARYEIRGIQPIPALKSRIAGVDGVDWCSICNGRVSYQVTHAEGSLPRLDEARKQIGQKVIEVIKNFKAAQ